MKKQLLNSILILMLAAFGGLSNDMYAQRIAAGGWHSLYVCNDGTVRACGRNDLGQLGDGTIISRRTPVQVSGLTSIIAVEGGYRHSLFLKNNGTVWACGFNSRGQLGDGTTTLRTTPVQVIPSWGTSITALAGGESHSIFLKNDGTVWACGWNVYGQLGDGTTINTSTPVPVIGLTRIIAIAAGFYHSLFLKNDGTVWACGQNYLGQLGDGTNTMRITPVQLGGLTGIIAVSAGEQHSLFLKNDGTVWACGRNNYGQLGDGSGINQSAPVQLSSSWGSNIIAVEAGDYHSLFLKNDGNVWGCGWNGGTFGDGTFIDQSTPVQAIPSWGGSIIALSGGYHSLFLNNNGTVWATGDNNYGQLGNGTTIGISTAAQVIGLCSVTLGTVDNAIEDTISIYPNPVKNILNIQNANNIAIDKIVITDMMGKKVMEQNGGDNIDVQNLQMGIYLIQISSGGNVYRDKFIKDKT